MAFLLKPAWQEFRIVTGSVVVKLLRICLGSRTGLLHNSYKGVFDKNLTPKPGTQPLNTLREQGVGAGSHEPPSQKICSVLHPGSGGRGNFYSRPDRLPGRPVSAARDNNLPRLSFPSGANFGELVLDLASQTRLESETEESVSG